MVVGAAIGAQEGVYFLLSRPYTLTAIPAFGPRQELQVLLIPMLVYSLTLGLGGAAWGVLLGLTKPHVSWPGDTPVVRGFYWGWWAFIGLGGYLLLSSKRPIVLQSLLLSPDLLVVGRTLILSLLAGLGTAFFVIRRSRVGMWERTMRVLGAGFSATVASLLLALWTGRLAYAPLAASLGLFVCLELVLFLLLWIALARRPRGGLLLAILLPLTVATGGWIFGKSEGHRAGDTERATGGIRVILITVDALRADHLPAYGYSRISTPAIDHLASQGVLFEHVKSHAPWALPSLCSLFTSLHPSTVGVTSAADRLDDAMVTMAEYTAGAGYVTQAMVTNAWLMQPFNVQQGFDGYLHFEERRLVAYEISNMAWYEAATRLGLARAWPGLARPSAARVTEEAMTWLRDNRERRFFLWVHYMDPHEPYEPPAGFVPRDKEPYLGAFQATSGYLEQTKSRVLTGADVRQLQRLYDGEIQYVDHHLGCLLGAVDSLGLTDSTLVVLVSDHGEEFLEHGDLGHGQTVHEEHLRVPLIIRCPALLPAGVRVPATVRLIDVLPTVLQLLGIEPSRPMQGSNLMDVLAIPGDGRRSCFAEANRSFHPQKALQEGPYKLIVDPLLGQLQVYDLARDSLEQTDLSERMPALVDELSEKLAVVEAENASIAARLPRGIMGGRVVADEFLRTRLRIPGYAR